MAKGLQPLKKNYNYHMLLYMDKLSLGHTLDAKPSIFLWDWFFGFLIFNFSHFHQEFRVS
jgi:hypothetical protein